MYDLEAVVTPTIENYLIENGHVASDYQLENDVDNPVFGLSVSYTGLVPLVYTTQHVLLSSLTSSLLTAFLLICIVMMIVLKSPSAGLVSMIPNRKR